MERARAQQTSRVHRIAIVDAFLPAAEISANGSRQGISQAWKVFFAELGRLGLVEGQNLIIERYSAEGRPERFRELAIEVVRRNPDLIYAVTGDLVLAFKAATTTIPTVCFTPDPIALGIVASLSRPGGNITGVSVDAGPEIWGTRLALLTEAVPRASRVGVVFTPTLAGKRTMALVTAAARDRGISLVGSLIDSPIEEAAYRHAFAAMMQQGADAVFVGDDRESFDFLRVYRRTRRKIPAAFAVSVARCGRYRRTHGLYVRAIRLGPSQCQRNRPDSKRREPGQHPLLSTAHVRACDKSEDCQKLGIEIAPSVLARADEVIE
jgi:putative ABC transport system substrate-binding protein